MTFSKIALVIGLLFTNSLYSKPGPYVRNLTWNQSMIFIKTKTGKEYTLQDSTKQNLSPEDYPISVYYCTNLSGACEIYYGRQLVIKSPGCDTIQGNIIRRPWGVYYYHLHHINLCE